MAGLPAAAAEPLVCGIDVGTSQIRAALFAPDGRCAAQAAAPAPLRASGPAMAELDAEALWQIVLDLLRQVVARVARPRRIRGLAVGSVGESGVLVGADGRALAPVLAWYDGRTRDELDRLLERVGFDRLHRLTGLCPDPTFGVLKLMWLRQAAPDVFAAGRYWLNLADYLALQLSGEVATDPSLASRTMLLDLERGEWAASLIEAAGVPPSLLPPLLASGTRLGSIRPEVAAATGLPSDLAVGVGGHDHACGLLGAGAGERGTLLDNLGTAEALSVVRDAPVRDSRLGRDGLNQGLILTERRHYYVFGGLPTAAAAVEWFRAAHGDADHAELIAEAEAADDSSGVMFLPHLRLGSPPYPDPRGRAALLGLSTEVGRGELFRAVLEGLALDAGNIMETMLPHLGDDPPARLLAIGGSTRNRLLLRLKASVYGRPLTVLDLPDPTCLGAALLGGVAAGLFATFAAARSNVTLGERLIRPEWDAAHRNRRRAAYAAAYAALRPVHAQLAAG